MKTQHTNNCETKLFPMYHTSLLTVHHLEPAQLASLTHLHFRRTLRFENPQKLSRFLIHVEQNYCFDPAAPNPYHTSLHAADVTLTVAHFCENSVRAVVVL